MYLSQKIGFDNPCKLSPKVIICMTPKETLCTIKAYFLKKKQNKTKQNKKNKTKKKHKKQTNKQKTTTKKQQKKKTTTKNNRLLSAEYLNLQNDIGYTVALVFFTLISLSVQDTENSHFQFHGTLGNSAILLQESTDYYTYRFYLRTAG